MPRCAAVAPALWVLFVVGAGAGIPPVHAEDGAGSPAAGDLDTPGTTAPSVPPTPTGGAGTLVRGPFGEVGLGTYGRVSADWDLRGGGGEPANLVAHGSRLEQAPYAEIDFLWRRSLALDPGGDGPRVRSVVTVAFDETLFHFDGDWQSGIALRNLYAEAEGLARGHLRLWAGSRMLRGDDIYLLDYWPVDNLNTLGGGAGLRAGPLDASVHVGVNRLLDDWQYETLEVVDDSSSGTREVVVLDRQRTLVTAQVRYERTPSRAGGLGFKAKVYGEVHALPDGTRIDPETYAEESLPADRGFAVGVQAGLWGFGRNGFANVFGRVGSGLAAYGDLAIPYGLDTDKTAARALEAVAGFSANVESGPLGLMAGGYLRYFRDADPNVSDLDDRFEWIVAVRPHLFFGRFYRQVFEVSVQQLIPHGLDPETDLQEPGAILKLSVMPSLGFDRATYARPEFRLVYTASVLDSGARLQYTSEDPRRGQVVQHYAGLGVEWWWGSASYGGPR